MISVVDGLDYWSVGNFISALISWNNEDKSLEAPFQYFIVPTTFGGLVVDFKNTRVKSQSIFWPSTFGGFGGQFSSACSLLGVLCTYSY